jgi:spermidine synthase
MEAGGAGSGPAANTKGSGGDAKPLPPCCVKAKAGVPESEAKCHDTVVSGWFTEPRSRSGLFRTRIGVVPYGKVLAILYGSDRC